ncbi:MAG: hypothetical protein ABI847_08115, partial [Anaerolineales bacterium]
GLLAAEADVQAPEVSHISSTVGFHVAEAGEAAAPAITRLTPASVVSGTAESWLTVAGHNFSSGAKGESVGQWNGQARETVVVDEETLLMKLTADDLAGVSTDAVTVFTPGTDQSSPAVFRVRAPGEKPVPVLTGVSQDPASPYRLIVWGSEFDANAQVKINGVNHATTFADSGELRVSLAPSEHSGLVTVNNPGPGGGLSNGVPFAVYRLYLPVMRR